MSETDPIIRTKLRLPFTRSELVPRLQLQKKLERGLRAPLTLVSAPAGFGKTTLVAPYVAGCGIPAAWLSLDKDDNHLARFLNYLLAAIQEAVPTQGKAASQLMCSIPQASPETVLGSLINDLENDPRDMLLVLEDYHHITSRDVQAAVVFLLEHCPRTFHLMIVSRSDPPLPLARLRGRDQIVELRAADLSFSQAEAAQFLNEIMGLELDAEAVAFLAERTEGWIVGLQMAALSMRDRKDISGFIEGFSGTNRYILDYLLEEVLANQPPELQRFLLHTAILERLTAELCEAVLADEGEMAHQRTAIEILEYLERANLFLVPLDVARKWYRYHHLFADLLRTQLHKSLGAAGVAQLHLRASGWLAQHGLVLEAISHASMASDDERVEHLIEKNYLDMLNRGEMAWVRIWTGSLSKDLIRSRPWLCIYEASNHAWYGELDEADRLLDQAERHLRSDTPAADHRTMHGHLAYIKSRVTAQRGDILRAIELVRQARQYFDADDLAMQLDTSITLGYEYFLHGDYVNARMVLEETIRLGTHTGSVINTVAAACLLARLAAVQCNLSEACEIYQKAAQFIPQVSGQHLGARALVEAGMAEITSERNDLPTALTHVEQALALMPWWGKGDDFVLANLTQARIHLARAEVSQASEAVKRALEITQTHGVFSEARHAAETAQVKLWLAQGDLAAARHWEAARAALLPLDGEFVFEHEPLHILRGCVLLALDRPEEANHWLSSVEQAARAAGRMGRVLEILLLKALALRESGHSEQALLALTEGLELGQPQGYVRLFLDEGAAMHRLLAEWLVHAHSSPARDYAIYLLSQFKAEPQPVSVGREQAAVAGELVETLSQRELEVLQLIALGKTNQEIAGILVISAGTVKAHTASIYRKLDVANRTQAVARAREIGLLL